MLGRSTNMVLDPVRVILVTKGSSGSSKFTVAERLIAATVRNHFSKTNVLHLATVEDWNTVFTLLCLHCDWCGVWMDGLSPMQQLYANGLGVVCRLQIRLPWKGVVIHRVLSSYHRQGEKSALNG